MSLFEKQPIIETKRFLLRQMALDDGQAVFENLSDLDVTKDMGVIYFKVSRKQ